MSEDNSPSASVEAAVFETTSQYLACNHLSSSSLLTDNKVEIQESHVYYQHLLNFWQVNLLACKKVKSQILHNS